jgi:hypothetical protein
MSFTGLYYPYIHFRSGDDWVKLAALYWDELYRIVPNDDQPEDSNVISDFRVQGGIEQGGFVKAVWPGRGSEVVSAAFEEFINGNRKRIAYYKLTNKAKWPPTPSEWLSRCGEAEAETKLARVFYGKLSEGLRKILVDESLAEDHPNDLELWMNPKLAFVFMTALAEEIAQAHGFQPLTDSVVGQIAVNGCTPKRLGELLLGEVPQRSATATEAEAILANIAISNHVPADISKMDVSEIIDFRRQNLAALVGFRDWVHSLTQSWDWLQGIKDNGTLNDRLRERYKVEMEPRIEALKSEMRVQKVKTALATIGISIAIPAAVNPIAGLFGVTADQTFGDIAGIALGLDSVLVDSQKGLLESQNKQGAYLLRLKGRRRPSYMVSAVRKKVAQLRGRAAVA